MNTILTVLTRVVVKRTAYLQRSSLYVRFVTLCYRKCCDLQSFHTVKSARDCYTVIVATGLLNGLNER